DDPHTPRKLGLSLLTRLVRAGVELRGGHPVGGGLGGDDTIAAVAYDKGDIGDRSQRRGVAARRANPPEPLDVEVLAPAQSHERDAACLPLADHRREAEFVRLAAKLASRSDAAE